MKIIKLIGACALCLSLNACIFSGLENGIIAAPAELPGGEEEVPVSGLSASTITATSGNTFVAVNWDAVDGASGYRLYKTSAINPDNLDSVDFESIQTQEDLTAAFEQLGATFEAVDVAGTAYDDENLTNGMAYCYTVAGVSDEEGPLSNGACGIPLGVTATAATATSGQVSVSWPKIPGAVAYLLLWKTASPILPSISKANGVDDGWEGEFIVEDNTDTSETHMTFEHEGVSNCLDYTYVAYGINKFDEVIPGGIDVSESPSATGEFVSLSVREDIPEDTFVDAKMWHDGIIVAATLWKLVAFDATTGAWTDFNVDLSAQFQDIDAIAVDANANIFVTGATWDYDVMVCKVLPDGMLDPSFAVEGCLDGQEYGLGTRGFSIAVDSLGRIVVVSGVVFRLTTDGELDPSFGSEGVYYGGSSPREPGGISLKLIGLGGASWSGKHVAMISLDGVEHVAVAGTMSISGTPSCPPEMACWEHHTVVLDESGLQVGGDVLVPTGGLSRGVAVAQLPSEELLAFGTRFGGTAQYIWSYYAEDVPPFIEYGTPDLDQITIGEVIVDCRGRPVIAGEIRDAIPNTKVALWRLDPATLAFDEQFGVGGWYLYPDADMWDGGNAIVEDELGRFHVFGYVEGGAYASWYPAAWIVK